MPYIDPAQRERLAPELEALAARVRDEVAADAGSFEGVLNYVLTSLVLATIPERRYRSIARVTGVLENVKQEFYRRYAAPYEDEQIARSGDVY